MSRVPAMLASSTIQTTRPCSTSPASILATVIGSAPIARPSTSEAVAVGASARTASPWSRAGSARVASTVVVLAVPAALDAGDAGGGQEEAARGVALPLRPGVAVVGGAQLGRGDDAGGLQPRLDVGGVGQEGLARRLRHGIQLEGRNGSDSDGVAEPNGVGTEHLVVNEANRPVRVF